MTDPAPNVELLEQTYDHIAANPDQHRQDYYRCETGMCFAGWAIELSGDAQWLFPPNDPWYPYDLAPADGEEPDSVAVLDDDTQVPSVSAASRATRILGLTTREASLLFHPGNTLSRIRELIDNIKEGVYRR